MPELLFALKACCIVPFSSAGVICCVFADWTGVYCSGGMDGSKNIFLFWAVKSCSLSSLRS
jgi:hypothetical protein